MATPIHPALVRRAKELLLAGNSAATVVRMLDLNVETVRRYKRGESRRDIVVTGEDSLRPAIAIEVPEVDAVPSDAVDTEAQASLEVFLSKLNEEGK